MNAQELLSKINIPEFCQRHGIRSFSIFGSYAEGTATPQSDLDVLVEFKDPVSLLKHVEVQYELQDLLGIQVDLLTPEGLNQLIKSRILKTTKTIYEKAG